MSRATTSKPYSAALTPLPTAATSPAPPPARRDVRVTFSPAGVTADDVIVQLVRDLPPDRAVAVATNDGEVRRGARSAGANLLTSDQLVALARRA